ARPGLDRGRAAAVLGRFGFLEEMKVDKRTLPDRASHGLPLLLRVTRPDDHLVGRFVVARTSTLGRLAPRGHRMTATRGAAFTTAVRMVDRVLRDAASERTLAGPAVATSLGEGLVGVVGVRHRAHRPHAFAADVTLFARTETHDDETAVTTDDLSIGASRTGDLATLARLHLDVVNEIGRASCRERGYVAEGT